MIHNQDKVFYNYIMNKTSMRCLIGKLVNSFGSAYTTSILDQLKGVGFEYATYTGISLGIDDLLTPFFRTTLMQDAYYQALISEDHCERGFIHAIEKLRQTVETWHATSECLKREMGPGFNVIEPLNPVHMMSFSGARGSTSQVHQLVGMRGLMSDPQGRIIDLPIQTNLREGLSISEYIISCYGARKGVVDTAIRTADAGYLTRRLVEVAQHLVIRHMDCSTLRGIYLRSIGSNQGLCYVSCQDRLIGRVLARSIFNAKRCIAMINQDIGSVLAEQIMVLNQDNILIRSPLMCRSLNSICQLCYGWNSNYGKLVQLGEAIGVIAGQSIGEPGTQLTLRTFHTGGVFTGDIAHYIRSPFTGVVHFDATMCEAIRNRHGRLALKCVEDTPIMIQHKDLQHFFKITKDTVLLVSNRQYIESKQVIAETTLIQDPFKERTKRYIYPNFQGQIIYTPKVNMFTRPRDYYNRTNRHKLALNNSYHIWVLSSKLYKNYKRHVSTCYRPNDYIDGESLIAIESYHHILKCVPTFYDMYRRSILLHYNTLKYPYINYNDNFVLFRSNRNTIVTHYNCVLLWLRCTCVERPQIWCVIILSAADLLTIILNNLIVANQQVNQFMIKHNLLRFRVACHNHNHNCNVLSTINLTSQTRFNKANVVHRIYYVQCQLNVLSDITTILGLHQMRWYNCYIAITEFNVINHLLQKWSKAYLISKWCMFNYKYFINKITQPIKFELILFIYEWAYLFIQNVRSFNLGALLSKSIIIANESQLSEAGQLICMYDSSAILRTGQPYLIISATQIYFGYNEAIDEQDPLMTLIYEQLRASDIIQGLPKIEQLLEGRSNNTLWFKLKYDFNVWMSHLIDLIHPYTISTETSILSIQISLVNRIQTVYLSQGVRISDKHVEIVVRQISFKVIFARNIHNLTHNPALLPGELVSLPRARRITVIFQVSIPYKPLLTGMTTSSLNADSFLAAASFERTTTILGTSALQGKVDWIKGLQENVIFGAMIPAGTGTKQLICNINQNAFFPYPSRFGFFIKSIISVLYFCRLIMPVTLWLFCAIYTNNSYLLNSLKFSSYIITLFNVPQNLRFNYLHNIKRVLKSIF